MIVYKINNLKFNKMNLKIQNLKIKLIFIFLNIEIN